MKTLGSCIKIERVVRKTAVQTRSAIFSLIQRLFHLGEAGLRNRQHLHKGRRQQKTYPRADSHDDPDGQDRGVGLDRIHIGFARPGFDITEHGQQYGEEIDSDRRGGLIQKHNHPVNRAFPADSVFVFVHFYDVRYD